MMFRKIMALVLLILFLSACAMVGGNSLFYNPNIDTPPDRWENYLPDWSEPGEVKLYE